MKCGFLSFRLEVAHTFRKIVVVERSNNFLSVPPYRLKAPVLRLLCLREVVQLCSAAEDLIRLRAGLTRLQAMKTIQAVPAVSHTWLEPANVTAVAQPCASDGSQKWRSISGISKAVLVSLCYLISSRLQTFCGGLVSCFIKILSCTEIFSPGIKCLSLGHGNTYCMRKTGCPTSKWRKLFACNTEKKNILHLLTHLQKREYSWELPSLCYLCDWSLVSSRQQSELSRVAEYQIIVGCLD